MNIDKGSLEERTMTTPNINTSHHTLCGSPLHMAKLAVKYHQDRTDGYNMMSQLKSFENNIHSLESQMKNKHSKLNFSNVFSKSQSRLGDGNSQKSSLPYGGNLMKQAKI